MSPCQWCEPVSPPPSSPSPPPLPTAIIIRKMYGAHLPKTVSYWSHIHNLRYELAFAPVPISVPCQFLTTFTHIQWWYEHNMLQWQMCVWTMDQVFGFECTSNCLNSSCNTHTHLACENANIFFSISLPFTIFLFQQFNLFNGYRYTQTHTHNFTKYFVHELHIFFFQMHLNNLIFIKTLDWLSRFFLCVLLFFSFNLMINANFPQFDDLIKYTFFKKKKYYN